MKRRVAQYMLGALGQEIDADTDDLEPLEYTVLTPFGGHIEDGLDSIKRLICVDQKPIGRTPRSNLATYTGLFTSEDGTFTTQA